MSTKNTLSESELKVVSLGFCIFVQINLSNGDCVIKRRLANLKFVIPWDYSLHHRRQKGNCLEPGVRRRMITRCNLIMLLIWRQSFKEAPIDLSSWPGIGLWFKSNNIPFQLQTVCVCVMTQELFGRKRVRFERITE